MEKIIKDIENYAELNHIPIVRKQTLKYLLNFVEKVKPNGILEIGTAIGYSGIKMLSVCDSSKLTTIEKNLNSFNLAKINFEKVGYSDRVNMICGDAFDEIKKLAANNILFDFIFLDGPKAQYLKYMEYIEKVCHSGTVIFADDVYFYGMVKTNVYPHRKKTIVVGLQNFLKYIEDPDKFETEVFDIEDGFAVIKVL